MKTVSIVIPVYNDAGFLWETIQCAKAQTYAPVEIIVVNDGSTDAETLNILSNVEQAGIKVLHKQNGHLASARNFGIQYAQGEFILPVDCDDKFASDFLFKAVPILEKNKDIGAVSCFVQRFGKDNKLWKPLGGGVQDFLFKNQCSSFGLFRKKDWKDIGGYDESMKYGAEDWDFWISLTKLGRTIQIIPESLFYYRQHESSMLKDVTYLNREKVIRHLVSKHSDIYQEGIIKAMATHKLLFLGIKLPTSFFLKLYVKKLLGKELYFE